jgi:hypothetical protein
MFASFDIAAAKSEIAARQALRSEMGLPALSTAVELRRMFNAYREREWQDYLAANNALLCRAIRRTVSRYRTRNKLPENWRPNSITGMGLQACVFPMMRRRYNRERRAARR